MSGFAEWQPWLLALHIIAVIAWMAGMLYLPRLFVYHAGAKPGSELSETLKVMERRLLRAIMNPAMIAVYVFGGLMLAVQDWHQGWLHAKLLLVLVLTVLELLWGRASLVVFAVFFDTGMPSTASVLQAVFNPRNWQFLAVYTAAVVVIVNLIVDLSYAWADPRVKYS